MRARRLHSSTGSEAGSSIQASRVGSPQDWFTRSSAFRAAPVSLGSLLACAQLPPTGGHQDTGAVASGERSTAGPPASITSTASSSVIFSNALSRNSDTNRKLLAWSKS